MANQLLTRQEVTFAGLEELENDCVIVPNVYRDLDKEFGKAGGKIGDTIYVRKPQRYIGRDGQAYQPEPMVDTEVPIVINQQSGVDIEFSTAEKKLSIDDFKRRTLDKAMLSIANKLDVRIANSIMLNTANFVGTPGSIPGLSTTDAFLVYSQANQKLVEGGFQMKGNRRILVISAAAEVGWNDYAKQFFNPQDLLARQWKTGQVNENALGYLWHIDENVPTQAIGTLGGTPAVTTAGQTGTSINFNGATTNGAGFFNAGDIISFANVYAVNPQSRLSTGSLKQFVVQQAVTTAGGAGTLTIMEAIVPSGQYQNVTAAPSAGALINVYNTAAAGQSALANVATRQGLLWTPECHAFVSFPGDVPEGVDMGFEARSQQIGVSLRFARVWDAYRDQWPNRFDVYYGMGPLYMEGGVRISIS